MTKIPTETVSFQEIKKAFQSILASHLDIQYILWTISASIPSGCLSIASIIKNSTSRADSSDTLSTGLPTINSGFTSPLLLSLKIVFYYILIRRSLIHITHHRRPWLCVHGLANFKIANCYKNPIIPCGLAL